MTATERPTAYTLDLPPEPTALRIFTDCDGDLWQLDQDAVKRGEKAHWRCIRNKVPVPPFVLTVGPYASWNWILFNLHPLTPVQWVEDEVSR